jgi:catechol 2,3-dioxygenase-like lactoylglutathione lyase family enzyme
MANETTPKFGFHHIALMCADIDKSLSMYKALGMQEVLSWGEGSNRIVMVDVGDGGRIELFANGSDAFSAQGKWQHFALRVDDVDAAYALARKVGFADHTPPKTVPLQSSPEKMTIHIAFVVGPDGEEVEFFTEV